MALPEAPSAAEMIRFLRANHPRHDKLELLSPDYDAMTHWTAKDRRQALQAAKSNVSITTLAIDVMDFTSNSATTNFITSMVGKLSKLKRVEIFDTAGPGEEPAQPAVVDKLLATIAKGPSKSIDTLEICHPSSPQSFLDFVDKFPTSLETLKYEDRYESYDDFEIDTQARLRLPFLMAISAAVTSRSQSLRHVGLQFEFSHPGIPCLLSALQGAKSNVQTVELALLGGGTDWDDALLQVSFLCAGTRTLRKMTLRGENATVDGVVDVYELFGVDPAPVPFSPDLAEMEFRYCSFDDGDDGPNYKALTARAANALQNVTSLHFHMCECPFALALVKKLPRLKELSYTSRQHRGSNNHNDEINNHDDEINNHDDEIDNEDQSGPIDFDRARDAYDGRFAFLRRNHDLTTFCHVIGRKSSLLEYVELDLHGTEHESFPALAKLLHVCRGTLALTLGCLPRASRSHLVNGLTKLNPKLKELQLCFYFCRFEDQDYADMLRPLQSNQTPPTLIFEWEREVGANVEQTRAAFHDLVQHTTSIETLGFGSSDPQVTASVLEATLPALTSTNRSIRALDTLETDLSEVWESRLQPLMLDMLKSNCSVSHLDGFNLPDNDPVAFRVKQNRYGRSLLMQGAADGSERHGSSSACPRGLWANILGKVSRDGMNDVMYSFLRSKPDLVLAGTVTASAVSAARGGSGGSGQRRTKGRKRGRGAGYT